MVTSTLCAIAEACGGCSLIHLSYATQLERKREMVAAVFARFPELEGVAVEPVRPAPRTSGYRTRAKLAASRVGNHLRLGLYAPGTHRVTDVGSCPVLHPRLAVLAVAIRDLASRPPYTRLPLTYVSLRHSELDAHSHLTLVLRDDQRDLASSLARELMAEVLDLHGVGLNLNPGPPLRVFGPTFLPLAGSDAMVERLGDRELELSPGAFFQANLDQAGAIVAFARGELGTSTTSLVDFYAGAGALGLALADPEARVTLVEGYDVAADDARRSAARNGFRAARVVASPAERVATSLARELGHADRVLVNPPRKGCSPEVLRAVADLDPERALYVSCDPATLARDLALLIHLGLRPVRVVPFDMLPQTDHVEVVAILAPVVWPVDGAQRFPVLFEDGDLRVVAKPALVPSALVAPSPELIINPIRADASGALLVAKNPEVARRLRRSLEAGEVVEHHVCLVRGMTRLEGAVATMMYSRRGTLHGHSLLSVTARSGALSLGRELAKAGHPIIGDRLHGHHATNRHFAEKYTVQRPLLHLERLDLPHPRGGTAVTVTAPLPGDFATALARLTPSGERR